MANPPLIAWADVPEGHYVWFRYKGELAWEVGQRAGRYLRLMEETTRSLIHPQLFDFAAAEQGPGALAEALESAHYANGVAELAMRHRDKAEADLTRLRDELNQSVNDVGQLRGRLQYAEERVTRLRDGLAALERECRVGEWEVVKHQQHDDGDGYKCASVIRTSVGIYIEHADGPEAGDRLAERIAALLTADDERQEREGHCMRCILAAPAYQAPNRERCAWALWNRAIDVEAPLPDLRALEAAYRAAVERG